jgi:hypothetical protein
VHESFNFGCGHHYYQFASFFSFHRPWLPSNLRLGPEGQFGDFVEGLGPAQLVGRQVLGSPCLGEIQLGLFDRKGHLEVEVIRARGLMAKPGTKVMPGKVLPGACRPRLVAVTSSLLL